MVGAGGLQESTTKLHVLNTRGQKHSSTCTPSQTLPSANITGHRGGGCGKLQGKLPGDAHLQVFWGDRLCADAAPHSEGTKTAL